MIYILKLLFWFIKPNHKNWESRLLLIRDDAFGDFILSTGTFQQLQQHYPTKKIYLLVNAPMKEVAELYFPAEQIICCHTHQFDKSFLYQFKMLRQIRSIGFQMVIGSMHRSSNCNKLAWLSGAEIKIGYEKEFFTSKIKHFNYYNQKVLSLNRIKQSSKEKYLPVIEHEAHYLSQITKHEIAWTTILPYLPLSEKKPIDIPEEPYFVFLPEAADLKRALPFEQALKLIELITSQHQIPCLVLGHGKGYDSSIFSTSNIYNKIGTTRFFDALYYIKYAKFIIGNETGLMHAAWVMNKPSTMLYGGGHYGRFLPLNHCCTVVNKNMPCYGCNWDCIYPSKTVPCIAELSNDTILEKLNTGQ